MEKYEKDGLVSYALGTQLVFTLLEERPELATKIYVSPKQERDETYAKLIALAKSKAVPVIENNEKIFRALSGKDNVMTLAEFKKAQQVLPQQGIHVVLVNPSNMGNLGTIIRSAAAFQASGLAIITPAADIYDPKTIRSSMGAFFHLPCHLYASFADYQKEMGARAYYPFMLQATTYVNETALNKPCSLIFGNEATGLPESFLRVGTPLKIPQSSLVDSLNLDNAVSIALYAASI
jgi:RNA methyltransferase, TrmH family